MPHFTILLEYAPLCCPKGNVSRFTAPVEMCPVLLPRWKCDPFVFVPLKVCPISLPRRKCAPFYCPAGNVPREIQVTSRLRPDIVGFKVPLDSARAFGWNQRLLPIERRRVVRLVEVFHNTVGICKSHPGQLSEERVSHTVQRQLCVCVCVCVCVREREREREYVSSALCSVSECE